MPSGNQKKLTGFTVFELVIVIVLLGIVSVFAIGRLFDSNQFKAVGYFNDVLNATRYAQKLAVSSGCHVQVQISGTGYGLFQPQENLNCNTAAFNRKVLNPADRSRYYQNNEVPTGYFLSASPANFVFTPRGVLASGSDANVTLSGAITQTFEVDAQTGLASIL